MANARAVEVKTPEARGSFVHLLERETKMDGSAGSYSMLMLFPKSSSDWRQDLPWLWDNVKECLMAQYPGGTNMPPVFAQGGAGKPFPVGDGDVPNSRGNVQEAHKGHWVLRVGSGNFNPEVNLMDGVTKTLGQMTQSTCYSGCFFQVIGNSYFYDVGGNLGVAFGMNNVLKTRDGESLGGSGGGGNAADAFGVVAESATATAAFAAPADPFAL